MAPWRLGFWEVGDEEVRIAEGFGFGLEREGCLGFEGKKKRGEELLEKGVEEEEEEERRALVERGGREREADGGDWKMDLRDRER